MEADQYSLAGVYVIPRSGGEFGFVPLEAMAYGIAVVASTLDGSREAVRDGYLGTLLDAANRDEIKSDILQALNLPRGAILEGLNYFFFGNFKGKPHTIIDWVVR